MLIVAEDSPIHRALRRLASERRMVFFVGLPGMGKSLMIHQLAHLAARTGRQVHLLQWDVARPVFEASDAAKRYPMVDGVTHGVIRKAVSLWSRHAVAEWDRAHAGPEHVLIGEAPLVGHRFIDLVRPAIDDAEPLLAAESCSFVIPVPSRQVRRFLEDERARRAARPAHEREREDAPPALLHELWRALVGVARELGVAGAASAASDDLPYEPLVYQRVYELVLKHRRVDVIQVDTVLPAAGLSAYDFAVERREITPSPAEAASFIREVDSRYPDTAALKRETDRWYVNPYSPA